MIGRLEAKPLHRETRDARGSQAGDVAQLAESGGAHGGHVFDGLEHCNGGVEHPFAQGHAAFLGAVQRRLLIPSFLSSTPRPLPLGGKATPKALRRRNWAGFSNDEILSRFVPGKTSPHTVLEVQLKLHNMAHTARAKSVSFKTRYERANFLRHFFRELESRGGCKVAPDPRNLVQRHIRSPAAGRWGRADAGAGRRGAVGGEQNCWPKQRRGLGSQFGRRAAPAQVWKQGRRRWWRFGRRRCGLMSWGGRSCTGRPVGDIMVQM